jgi:hypothetical protein
MAAGSSAAGAAAMALKTLLRPSAVRTARAAIHVGVEYSAAHATSNPYSRCDPDTRRKVRSRVARGTKGRAHRILLHSPPAAAELA